MRLSTTILTFLIFFGSVQFCLGQEKPQAVLFDQFGGVPCDDFLMRIDMFFNELQNDPNSTGYAVIYTRENLSKLSIWRLNVIGGQIDFRKFDPSRISIVRAKKDTEIQIEFWRVPAGADRPSFGEEWSNVLPSSAKPFIFTTSFYDHICPVIGVREYWAFLEANPDSMGHLAVYQTPKRKAKKEADFWLKILSKDHKIPRNRLKVFYGKADRPTSGTEFWIVPAKRK